MIERYTEKAIKVLLFAQEEAFMAKHGKLYPEHILAGIVREASGLSSKLLKSSGVNIDMLRETIHSGKFSKYQGQSPNESMPFSPGVKKILREAWYDVQSAGTYYVTPENLFLSLLRDDESQVISLLKDFSVNIEKIKASVANISKKSVKPSAHPEETPGARSFPARIFDKSVLFDRELKPLMETAAKKLEGTNHEAFGTEQLVQAILENKGSWACKILEQEGITQEGFEQKLKEFDSRKDEYNTNEPEFTPKASRALYSAQDITKELGSTHIKPEHILLGILKENRGIACKIFSELGINADKLYQKIAGPIEKEKPEILTIIKLAREEARSMEQNIVGTEQLLLGILGEGSGIASHVLRNLGVTLRDARAEVQKILGFGHNYSENNKLIFTPRAERIISLAWSKAKQLNKQKFTSEHLLLAITGEKDSIAMRVLENLGVDTVEIKQGILNEIRKSAADTEINE